ncbi:hypothetical protein Tco_1440731 [Tanacetum coccineum]
MEPILGMRFHHPEQLKLCLANYGVANRKKKELGEDESLKVNKVTTRSRSKSGEGTRKSPKTHVKAITSGEGCFESPKWTKAKEVVGRGFGGIGEGTATMGESSATIGATRRSQRGRGRGYRGRGSGQRERGSGQRGKGRGRMQRDEAYETHQDEFNQEALRYTLEEEARFKKEDEEKSVAANMSDMGERGFRLGDIEAEDNYRSNAELGIPSVDHIEAVTPTANKGKQVAEPSEQHDLQPLPKNRG